jgi:hypothetical protein
MKGGKQPGSIRSPVIPPFFFPLDIGGDRTEQYRKKPHPAEFIGN